MDNNHKLQDNSTPVSDFETIDQSLFNWINETLDIQCTTNEGLKKVPVIWFSTERSYQIKAQKENRDENGFLDFPQIMVERKSTTLTPVNDRPIPGIIKGSGDYKNNQFGFWKKISQIKTRNFANATSQRLYNQQNFKFKNNEIVNEFVFVPYPSYYDMTYEISLKAIYMQQINEMVAPLQRFGPLYNSQVFTIHYNGFKFEAFLPKETDFKTNAPDIAEDEKIYESKFSIKVLGFTTTSQTSQTTPNIVYREGPAKVRISRERVIFGDVDANGDPFKE